MKKVCFAATVPTTLESFLIPTAEYLLSHTDWDISFICDYDEAFSAKIPEGIHYIPIPMARGISLGGIGAMLKMVKIFRKEKFDLVQYSTPNASFYAAIAAKLTGIPARLYCQWGIAYVGFSGLKRRIFKQIEKMVCHLSTWIEPDSRGNLDFSHTEGLYPATKGSVVWNGSASGVNLTKFDIGNKEVWRKEKRAEYGIPDDAFVMEFVGRLTRDKGINELFSAGKVFLQQHSDAYLLLVGSDEGIATLDQTLYQWAAEEPRVIFGGSTNVVEQYLSAADVSVLPSYREGFGMTVIEAQAMGVPVIVSDIPGPTDAMVKDVTGLTVPARDAEALYHAMDTLAKDPELRRQYGRAGHQFVAEHFEQQKLCRHILDDRRKLLEMD